MCFASASTAEDTEARDDVSSASSLVNSPFSLLRNAVADARASLFFAMALASFASVVWSSALFAAPVSMAAVRSAMVFVARSTAAVFSFSLVSHQQLIFSDAAESSFCSLASCVCIFCRTFTTFSTGEVTPAAKTQAMISTRIGGCRRSLSSASYGRTSSAPANP